MGRNVGFFNRAPPLFKNPVRSYFSHMHRFMTDTTVKEWKKSVNKYDPNRLWRKGLQKRPKRVKNGKNQPFTPKLKNYKKHDFDFLVCFTTFETGRFKFFTDSLALTVQNFILRKLNIEIAKMGGCRGFFEGVSGSEAAPSASRWWYESLSFERVHASGALRAPWLVSRGPFFQSKFSTARGFAPRKKTPDFGFFWSVSNRSRHSLKISNLHHTHNTKIFFDDRL